MQYVQGYGTRQSGASGNRVPLSDDIAGPQAQATCDESAGQRLPEVSRHWPHGSLMDDIGFVHWVYHHDFG